MTTLAVRRVLPRRPDPERAERRMPSLVVALLVASGTAAGGGGTPTDLSALLRPFYDFGAYLVLPNDTAPLQQRLEQHTSIRLLQGDYSRGGTVQNITLRSGMRVYGLPGSRLPPVVVAAGTTGAALSTVRTTLLYFAPASSTASAPTRGNAFQRVYQCNIVFDPDAAIEDTLFVDLFHATDLEPKPVAGSTYKRAAIFGNFSGGTGYLRGSKFIKLMTQATAPLLYLIGGTTHRSYGNTVLWANSLAGCEHMFVGCEQMDDLAVVGASIEVYGGGTVRSNFFARDMGAVRLSSVEGGVWLKSPNETAAGPYDLDAHTVELTNIPFAVLPNTHGSDPAPGNSWQPAHPPPWDLRLGPSNRFFLQAGGADLHTVDDSVLQPAAERLRLVDHEPPVLGAVPVPGQAFRGGKLWQVDHLRLDGANVSAGQNLPSTTQQQAIVAALEGALDAPPRKGAPWARPTFRPIPDLAGPNWKSAAATAPDQHQQLQALVDTANTSIALLLPGIYHISATLLMSGACGTDGVFTYGVGCAQSGLLGAGDDQAVIVAKSPAVAMINPGATVGNPAGYGASIYVAGLTLQGGRCGICSVNRTGAVVNAILLSHVTFRDMAEAGVVVDGVMGWDNNMLDFLNFVNNAAGIKQLGRCGPSCGLPNGAISYMDKNVFYRNQFVGNRVAVDLTVLDHSDGSNHWIDCWFENNTDFSLTGTGMISATHFANSVFKDNGGNPTINWNTPGAAAAFGDEGGDESRGPAPPYASRRDSSSSRDCVNQTWMAEQPSCPIWSRAINIISCVFNYSQAATTAGASASTQGSVVAAPLPPRSILPPHAFVEGSEFLTSAEAFAVTLLPAHSNNPSSNGLWAQGSLVMMHCFVSDALGLGQPPPTGLLLHSPIGTSATAWGSFAVLVEGGEPVQLVARDKASNNSGGPVGQLLWGGGW